MTHNASGYENEEDNWKFGDCTEKNDCWSMAWISMHFETFLIPLLIATPRKNLANDLWNKEKVIVASSHTMLAISW